MTEKSVFFSGEGVKELKRGGAGHFSDLSIWGEGAWRKIGGRCFWRQRACHDITKSADSQTNKNFLDNECMTAQFYKNVY